MSLASALATMVAFVAALAATSQPAGGSVAWPRDSFPPGSSLPPPEGLDELSPGLLGAPDVGVPDTWAIVDLDPALLMTDERFAGDRDPFRGLLTCPAGAIRDESAPWLARKFSADGLALDNGLLTLELILEWESTEEFEADLTLLEDCHVRDGATLELTSGEAELLKADQPLAVPFSEIEIRSEATDDVPYESAMSAVWMHVDDRTVAVIFGGLAGEHDWSEAVQQVALLALAELVEAELPTPTA